MKLISDKHFPLRVLTIAIVLGLTLPVLVRDGMFMDGMLYISVAHNLSEGIGTFWFPQFSYFNMAGLNSFHEQPPLCFGIESLFFKLFGNSMYVERLYTFTTLCITVALIYFFWKEIFKNNHFIRKLSWIPVLLWITIPVCYWSYCNNMCENTMGIFTLLAVFLLYKNVQKEKSNNFLLIISGICILLATLSKGFPGFFPLGFPVLFWLTNKKIVFKRILLQTFILFFVVGIIYVALFAFPLSRESLKMYLFQRAFQRIENVPTTTSHFFILESLFQNLLPQFIFVLLILIISRVRKTKAENSFQSKNAFLFLLIGFSATLPLMLTLVQKGFYFVPALPFFAIAFAIIISPAISFWIDKIKTSTIFFRALSILSIALVLAVFILTISNVGKTSHDKETLHDVYLIGKIVPKFSVVSVPASLWNDWDLQCYLIRYFNISLDDNKKDENYFYLSQMNFTPDSAYHKLLLPTEKYQLFTHQ